VGDGAAVAGNDNGFTITGLVEQFAESGLGLRQADSDHGHVSED
jgi:hypothetical protein